MLHGMHFVRLFTISVYYTKSNKMIEKKFTSPSVISRVTVLAVGWHSAVEVPTLTSGST